ncbi:hypothetical protein Spb1_00350 [Planctopirus ephydatiae]|uniref:Uncharacterized protein n=1 Tax=Planctopirus ephydatiae TaxID=2528019 RepID=A0A518GHV5_9PLAN|nr:hypothetical protein [Planctopirus ephydatiae]QDV28172.1 hypothetical protein Spb1_00350 [Planctopirus ephydatiae]
MSPQEIVTDDRPGNGTVWLLRLLAGFQFLGGIFFATFTWMLILVPLGIFHPQYQYQLRDVVFSITGATLAITGYFVWWNWFLYAVRGRFFSGLGSGCSTHFHIQSLGLVDVLPFSALRILSCRFGIGPGNCRLVADQSCDLDDSAPVFLLSISRVLILVANAKVLPTP